MRTILVATDYSDPGINAVEYAAQLAHDTGADLVIFNVYKPSIHATTSLASADDVEVMVRHSEERVKEYAKEIEKRFSIDVRWELRKDDPIESLKEYTRTHLVDLVVMGIQSNLIEYRLFGNTTTAAIELMQFPLLVVPNDIRYEGIHKVMYACDPAYVKDDVSMEILRKFIKAVNAQLEVLHVLTNSSSGDRSDELERVMEGMLEEVNHAYRYVKNPKVGAGIDDGLQSSPADLLVMIHHKPGFFESLIKGSNTNQMTVKTRVPLLVIPNKMAG